MKTMNVVLAIALALCVGSCGGGGVPVAQPADQAQPEERGQLQVLNGSLDVELSSTGLELLTPATGSLDTLAGAWSIEVITPKGSLRRIVPGDIPYGGVIGEIISETPSSWQIKRLPLDQVLLLKLSCVPAANLSTGVPVTDLTANANQPIDICVPFSCSTEELTKLGIEISFEPQLDSSYLINVQSKLDTVGGSQTIATRLDYKNDQLSRDSDLDGQFEDEAWLADDDHNGISNLLAIKYASENKYLVDQTEVVTLHGRLTSVDEANGKLWLIDAVQISEQGLVKRGYMQVNFTEGTRFDELLVDKFGELVFNKAPSSIESLTQVALNVQILPNYRSAKSAYWLTHSTELCLDFPDDTIVAVPSQQTAVPGEAVTVTVYVNKTSQPFYALNNVRVVFEKDNEVLRESLNAGSRGGSSITADGIWAMMNTDRVATSAEQGRQVSAVNGLAYADFSLRPSAGEEIVGATGALFNFQLICHDNATPGIQSVASQDLVTSFSDMSNQTHVWSHVDEIKVMPVIVAGRPLSVSLTDPPQKGTGQENSPYITEAGSHYQLRLIDPDDGDVTLSSKTNYLISTTGDLRKLTITNGELSIATGFTGRLWICGYYDNVFTKPDQHVYLQVGPGSK